LPIRGARGWNADWGMRMPFLARSTVAVTTSSGWKPPFVIATVTELSPGLMTYDPDDSAETGDRFPELWCVAGRASAATSSAVDRSATGSKVRERTPSGRSATGICHSCPSFTRSPVSSSILKSSAIAPLVLDSAKPDPSRDRTADATINIATSATTVPPATIAIARPRPRRDGDVRLPALI